MATPEKQREALAENIEAFRKGSGKTKRHLYTSLGIHQSTFDRKLSGESDFKFFELAILARALGVKVSELTKIQEGDDD